MNSRTSQELKALHEKFTAELSKLEVLNLNLDLTRGKPGATQLDLSNEIDGILDGNYIGSDGVDTRNYGGIDGIPEAKSLFSHVLGVTPENILVGGNSSLTLMYQYMSHAFHFGVRGPDSAWAKNFKNPSFLCPAPGYDRHFEICQAFGIKMHVIEMDENGPIIKQIKNILAQDKEVCGMWCVPKYSNPTGIIYSDQVVKEIASLHKIAPSNFRIFWDNAYAEHDFSKENQLANLYTEAAYSGGEDSVLMFASTSKITHAGSGVSFLGTSPTNLSSFIKFLSSQTIGPDKVNQLRHVRFFGSYGNLKSHMRKHGEILEPKFNKVYKILNEEIGSLDIAKWSIPEGGYFISLDTLPGLAKKVVALCNKLGVKLTPAGATFPYGEDPNDSNIRIAPSMPNLKELEIASRTLALAVGLLSTEKLLEDKA